MHRPHRSLHQRPAWRRHSSHRRGHPTPATRPLGGLLYEYVHVA